jgi:hypothetical protein
LAIPISTIATAPLYGRSRLHWTLGGSVHARWRSLHLTWCLGFVVTRHAPLDLDGLLLSGLVLADVVSALGRVILAGNVNLPLLHLALADDLDGPVIRLR